MHQAEKSQNNPNSSKSNQKIVYLAFGCNHRSQPRELIRSIDSSYRLLESDCLTNVEYSSFFQTPAFPVGFGPDYVNSVIKGHTSLSTNELINVIHKIENELGRVRTTRWGTRVIDIDIIDYEGLICPDLHTYKNWQNMPLEQQKQIWPDQLILPHPRIQDRGFVLKPLKDVAPDWVHPVTKENVNQLLSKLPTEELNEIVRLPDHYQKS